MSRPINPRPKKFPPATFPPASFPPASFPPATFPPVGTLLPDSMNRRLQFPPVTWEPVECPPVEWARRPINPRPEKFPPATFPPVGTLLPDSMNRRLPDSMNRRLQFPPVECPPVEWARHPFNPRRMEFMEEDEQEEDRTMKHFSHDHELSSRLLKRDGSRSCSLCEDPVVGPNYWCDQCSGKFVLHKSCAKLPREILKYPFHSCKHPLILGTSSSSSRYACGVCHQEYNGGFSYTCSECDFKVDIKCSKIDYQLPEHFIHKHPLMLNEDVAEAAGRPVSCSGCKDPVLGRTTTKRPYRD